MTYHRNPRRFQHAPRKHFAARHWKCSHCQASWIPLLWLLIASGCYAPLHSRGIPARTLPDDFRFPYRTAGPSLNLSSLTIQPPRDYLLGPSDELEVTVPGIYERAEVSPVRTSLMGNGEVQLPLVGAVPVAGLNLMQAQRAITDAYAKGYIVEPRINVVLAEKSTISVLVLGQVNQPGLHVLPKYENDVGHAIGAALGLADEAGNYIEVHRQVPASAVTSTATKQFDGNTPVAALAPSSEARHTGYLRRLPATEIHSFPMPAQAAAPASQILRIPLRGPGTSMVQPDDVMLSPGDVIVVPNRRHEVFYVVGRLNSTNTVRFTVGNRERELGVGLLLPRDRDIDVVTAVAMAGYIDPIDSPTTVTVQRSMPDGSPLLIRVDLIQARYDARETVLVRPGDIIYLNPDGPWWWRRTLDRVLGSLITIPYDSVFRR